MAKVTIGGRSYEVEVRGDAVVVRDGSGLEIARGLTAYSSADAERICGRRSAELEGLLGYRGRDEMIHRDDLVLS